MNNFTDNSKNPNKSMFAAAGKNFTVAKRMLDEYESNLQHIAVQGPLTAFEQVFRKMVDGMVEEYNLAQPVRKIRANRRSLTGWINGHHGRDPVPFESSIERDCAYQLLFDQRVLNVQSQPLTITFPAADVQNRSYTPDYLVEFMRNGEQEGVLVECKSEDEWQTNKQRLTKRYSYVSEWAQKRDLSFVLLTDKHVQGVSLENIKLLLPQILVGAMNPERYSRFQPDILATLPAANIDVLQKVDHLFPSQTAAQTEILAMIAKQRIVCDLNMPLEMSTVLKKKGSGWEPQFLFDRGIKFGS